MQTFLQLQHIDPYHKLDKSSVFGNLQVGWIFDFIGSLEKAKSSHSQGFGFSSLSQHPESNREQIGNMNVGAWCSCFMNQYFNRLPGFSPPIVAINYVAKILSEKLK